LINLSGNLNKLYELEYKTKIPSIKKVLNSFLSNRNNKPLVNINNDKAEELNFLRASIKTNKHELEFKYETVRKTFGRSAALTQQQKILIERYIKFTSYLLNDIPFNKQVKEFKARDLLDLFEKFYSSVFGPDWLNNQKAFITKYNQLIKN